MATRCTRAVDGNSINYQLEEKSVERYGPIIIVLYCTGYCVFAGGFCCSEHALFEQLLSRRDFALGDNPLVHRRDTDRPVILGQPSGWQFLSLNTLGRITFCREVILCTGGSLTSIRLSTRCQCRAPVVKTKQFQHPFLRS